MSKFSAWTDKNFLSEAHLAIFRIAFAAFYLVFSGMPRFDWISDFPSFFYRPPLSLASFFNAFPPKYFFQILNVALPLFAFCILIGFKTFWSSVLFGITLIVGLSFVWAFGVINHPNLIAYTAVIFAFSGWGNRFSVDEYLKKSNSRFQIKWNVIPFYSLIVAFSYFTSGFSKITGGWLSFDNQASYVYLIDNYFVTGRQELLATLAVHANASFLWEVIDYLVCAIEVLPFFFLFNPRIFRTSLLLLTIFHLVVYLTLNIAFSYFPLFFCVFVVDWNNSPAIRKTTAFIGKYAHRFFSRPRWIWFLLAFAVYMLIYLLSDKNRFLNDYPPEVILSLFISSILVVYFYFEKNGGEKRSGQNN